MLRLKYSFHSQKALIDLSRFWWMLDKDQITTVENAINERGFISCAEGCSFWSIVLQSETAALCWVVHYSMNTWWIYTVPVQAHIFFQTIQRLAYWKCVQCETTDSQSWGTQVYTGRKFCQRVWSLLEWLDETVSYLAVLMVNCDMLAQSNFQSCKIGADLPVFKWWIVLSCSLTPGLSRCIIN